jgi:putative endonuclease
MNRRGEPAENLAVAFLEREGLRILERNYRCKLGEIDLVAQNDETLVFVEGITPAKRARVIRAAKHYLVRHKIDKACRFDVVLVTGSDQRIEWLPGAFSK